MISSRSECSRDQKKYLQRRGEPCLIRIIHLRIKRNIDPQLIWEAHELTILLQFFRHFCEWFFSPELVIPLPIKVIKFFFF